MSAAFRKVVPVESRSSTSRIDISVPGGGPASFSGLMYGLIFADACLSARGASGLSLHDLI
jgi:hypothetical protein